LFDVDAANRMLETTHKERMEKLLEELDQWTDEADSLLMKAVGNPWDRLDGDDIIHHLSRESVLSTAPQLERFGWDTMRTRYMFLYTLHRNMQDSIRFFSGWSAPDDLRNLDVTTLPLGQKVILMLQKHSAASSHLRLVEGVVRSMRMRMEVESGNREEEDCDMWDDNYYYYHDAYHLNLNRAKALTGKESLFEQAFAAYQKDPKVFSMEGADQPFRVSYIGEGASDRGGPFSDAMTNFSIDMQSASTGLFIPCPNGAAEVGTDRQKLVPDPNATSATQLEMFKFVGRLMGLSVVYKFCTPLEFPSIVWKGITKEPRTRNDLRRIDLICCQNLDSMENMEKEGITEEWFNDNICLTFSTLTSDGSQVDLVEGGAERKVGWHDRIEYCQLVERYKLAEFDRQIEAIRKGFESLVPYEITQLCSWSVLEFCICGDSDISVELLKKNSELHLPTDDKRVQYLWEALTSFSPKERSTFLQFVWGRSRLPVSSDGWVFIVEDLDTSGKNPDDFLPASHTCFFQLDLPNYTSVNVMKEKLLYAISECKAIDTDFVVNSEDVQDYNLDN